MVQYYFVNILQVVMTALLLLTTPKLCLFITDYDDLMFNHSTTYVTIALPHSFIKFFVPLTYDAVAVYKKHVIREISL